MSANTELAALYAELPMIACKGKCQDYCGPVVMSDVEYEHLSRAMGKPFAPAMTCPLLVLGRCSQYRHRPLICRVWGCAEGLECPHGCEPSRWLTREEVGVLIARADALR